MWLGLSGPAITPARAVAVGHLVITLPCCTLIVAATLAVLPYASPGAVPRMPLAVAIAFIVLAFVVAWLWWSLAVPRWRAWAVRKGCDPATLECIARRTWLVWREGSWLARTEWPLGRNSANSTKAPMILKVASRLQRDMGRKKVNIVDNWPDDYASLGLTASNAPGTVLRIGLVLPVGAEEEVESDVYSYELQSPEAEHAGDGVPQQSDRADYIDLLVAARTFMGLGLS